MKMKNKLNVAAAIALCIFALSPQARAVCQDGCDISTHNTFLGEDALVSNTTGYQNTATGEDALANNTTGYQNTAVGEIALYSNTIGHNNTAVGEIALDSNITGNNNTALGSVALTYNTIGNNNTAVGESALLFSTGSNNTATGFEAMQGLFGEILPSGSNNTATGYQALFSFTTGGSNTANGYLALNKNTTGSFNTATGRGALYKNTTASNNVATGYQALNVNQSGTNNTATGTQALQNNTGSSNTATGYQALQRATTAISNTADGYQALNLTTTGFGNTAVGASALGNNSIGYDNIAVGIFAGGNLTTGNLNIDIGNSGVAAETNTMRLGTTGQQTNTYIAGINGVTVAGGIGVIIDSNGHLGTSTSSARYKENIQPMDSASEAILSLEPVTFRYKKDLDPKSIPQFGLVAEQVEKVDRDLVVRDEQGKPYSVRYEAVNAMLLNEFLKEHRKVEKLEAALTQQEKRFAEQEKDIKALSARLQKVSNQFELSKAAPRLAVNRLQTQ